jgi:molybdopterin-guanine dinucleotide biosynthesis protein A
MNNCPGTNLIGVVLAGGKSSRLGQDKAELLYQGQTMLQRSIDLLQSLCRQVLVSGRNEPGLLVPAIKDDTPGLGPIGGICTALRVYGGPLLVISCDLPFLNEKTLAELIKTRDFCKAGQAMTTYQQIETGFIEALVAIYEDKALSLLQEAISAGCYKLSKAIPCSFRCHIPYSQKKARVFFNLNKPQDLEKLYEENN